MIANAILLEELPIELWLNKCQNKNATLGTIRSQAQMYFMKTSEITSNTWIGLTETEQEGSWKWKMVTLQWLQIGV